MTVVMMAVFACGVLAQVSETGSGRELFADAAFELGFVLTGASSLAPKIELGVLQMSSTQTPQQPAWRMAQWGSRYLLEPGLFKSEGGNRWLAETPGKRVVVERSEPGRTCVRLEVLGLPEYAGHLRAYGEAWPHLLLEQRFDNPVALRALKRLAFSVEMRIPYCKAAPDVKLDPGLHTAQVSAFWSVHNMTRGNPDFQDMIWFGIPFFDARWDIPWPNYSVDSGKADATQKFICMLDGKRFWKGRTGDGQWRKLDAELCGLIREGLAISQEHGFLKSTRFEDLAIATFNLGWEVPGPYDAALEFRDLSMKAFD